MLHSVIQYKVSAGFLCFPSTPPLPFASLSSGSSPPGCAWVCSSASSPWPNQTPGPCISTGRRCCLCRGRRCCSNGRPRIWSRWCSVTLLQRCERMVSGSFCFLSAEVSQMTGPHPSLLYLYSRSGVWQPQPSAAFSRALPNVPTWLSPRLGTPPAPLPPHCRRGGQRLRSSPPSAPR